MQLHYVTLLSVGISGVFWLLSLRTIAHQKRSQLIQFVLATLGAVTLFTAFFIPLVLFDLRHQFLNFHSLQSFLTEDSGGFNHGGSTKRLLKAVAETQGRSMQILAEMFIGKFRDLNTLVATVLIGAMAFWSWQKKQQHQVGYQLLFLCVAVSVLILAFYQSSIFPHYLAFLYPITCLIYGVVMDKLVKNLPGKVFALICVGGFLVWNAQHMPFESLSWTVRDTQRTAEMIAQRIKPGEKYNIVLLTSTGDIEGLNYRYFLETTGSPPLPREQWGEADTLYIINEDKRLARVVESPVYEIVVFPNKTPTEVYTIPNGPEITVLRR